ncbi:MAG: DUF6382 domain-containing protein [Lachnospiraceae bacterium]|nr:DUF6382 domain-containing protein [Lachnospiraceae bacterium]
MKAEYKRDLQNNYLILKIPGGLEEEGYRIRMAEQNKIAGLLSFYSSRKDGVLQLYYEITSMQSLESVFEKKKMSYQDIVFVLSGIRSTLEEMQKYLLNPAQIVFDPQYIFIGPDRRSIELCYVPGNQNDTPITVLAEYILKRLDHEDRQAVTIGYGFYQKALEENFSLQKVLKDILSSVKEKELHRVDMEEVSQRQIPERRNEPYIYGDTDEKRGYPADKEDRNPPEDKNIYEVVHKERKKRSGKVSGKLFSIIHPVLLLSCLFLIAVIEILFYFGYLNLTEAGGVFFLLISVEMLINKYWHSRKERKKQEESRWVMDEESEIYKALQEEMYEVPQRGPQMEETRCLVPSFENNGVRLICIHSGSRDKFQDITMNGESICVGKIKGESDVLLDSPTVSRIHAKLFCRNDTYYVKDLNSKNGTFCNGVRLQPQEERQFAEGDRIAFAEIEYQVAEL